MHNKSKPIWLAYGMTEALQLSEKFRIAGFPTVVFLGRDGREERRLRLEGVESADEFVLRLEAAREYRNLQR
jgi:hypothetical protein